MRWRSVRSLLSLIAAVLVGVVVSEWLPPPLPELTRAEFMDEVRAGHVQRIEIEDQQVILSESSTRGEFRTGFDKTRDAGLPDELRALGVEVWFSKSPPGI